ncbi:hypothetical protein SAMN04488072_11366 [Lentibacillus halodurans]|uniref:Uncharacterized protein n=1 Tax=Lentibacillus halodurans TaxID=237679 RepID=A0A1I0ZT55_9BACI|nr:hypothetical protein [Lentibacillus halodurans]SFB28959.1 hypothetical protein SAMN04488072_11366 [Lentibacillus halodurans]
MGKKAVLLIVVLTLAVLLAGWLFLQHVMIDYDVDRDISQPVQSEINKRT